jgi:hypothetical protein
LGLSFVAVVFAAIARYLADPDELHNEREDTEEKGDYTSDSDKPADSSYSSRTSVDPAKVKAESDKNKWKAEEHKVARKLLAAAKLLNVVTGVAAAIGIIGLVFVYFSFEETRAEFKAAQRAYVVFGSGAGTLAEFGPAITEKADTKSVKLHFVNTGQTTALHFAVAIFPNLGAEPTWFHRHRFIGLNRSAVTAMGIESDLPAKAEHVEYITDPNVLWSDRTIGNHIYVLNGEFEYCDIFGQYHCQPFATTYKTPINEFVGWTLGVVPCRVEHHFPTDSGIAEWLARYPSKEIAPCEQPDEPEYYEERAEKFLFPASP